MSRLVNFAISILLIVPYCSCGGSMKHKNAIFKLGNLFDQKAKRSSMTARTPQYDKQ
jgi:hypothetical protein